VRRFRGTAPQAVNVGPPARFGGVVPLARPARCSPRARDHTRCPPRRAIPAPTSPTPPGNKERDPQWSPDAKHRQPLRRIRRDALHVSPQNGAGSVTKIELRPGFYRCRSNPPDQQANRPGGHLRAPLVRGLGNQETVRSCAGHLPDAQPATFSGVCSPDSKWLGQLQGAAEPIERHPSYSLPRANPRS